MVKVPLFQACSRGAFVLACCLSATVLARDYGSFESFACVLGTFVYSVWTQYLVVSCEWVRCSCF